MTQLLTLLLREFKLGEAEPDVDNIENIFTGPPPSGYNSAGSSPSTSTIQQALHLPQGQGVIGTNVLSPANYRPTLSPSRVPLPQPLLKDDSDSDQF